jgi:hypothetical protein
MFHPKHVELFAGNKMLYKKRHLVGTNLKLIHDARTDEQKKMLKNVRFEGCGLDLSGSAEGGVAESV